MKKIMQIMAAFFVIVFSACVDTEEIIEINADNSGVYTIILDMNRLYDIGKSFKSNTIDDEDTLPNLKIMDSTVYFKDFILESNLKNEEIDLYKEGYLTAKMNEAKKEMKMIISCPFKNMDQLKELKANLLDVVEKLNLDKRKPSENEGKNFAKTVFPFANEYNFDATNGHILNNIIDIKSFRNRLAEEFDTESDDDALENPMASILYKSRHTITIKSPKKIKKFSGPNATQTKDKKNTTFTFSNLELVKDPLKTIYMVEY